MSKPRMEVPDAFGHDGLVVWIEADEMDTLGVREGRLAAVL